MCDTITIVTPGRRSSYEVVEAPALELLVAHRDDLVDDEDLRVDVDGDGEAEPHVHAARVDASPACR